MKSVLKAQTLQTKIDPACPENPASCQPVIARKIKKIVSPKLPKLINFDKDNLGTFRRKWNPLILQISIPQTIIAPISGILNLSKISRANETFSYIFLFRPAERAKNLSGKGSDEIPPFVLFFVPLGFIPPLWGILVVNYYLKVA